MEELKMTADPILEVAMKDGLEPFCPYEMCYCNDAYTERCPGFEKCKEG